MKLPDTMLDPERYLKHFIGDDTETVELLAVKSETERANFGLPAEALAALKELAWTNSQ
jgi:hypothetical protein